MPSIDGMLLLLLLSCFSHVRLCATPRTAAYQASPSLGFSRQEHWSGLPFPSPRHESGKWKGSRSVCPTLSDPMDCSLRGSSVHGIFQARVLEWGAIAFSHRLNAIPIKISTNLKLCCKAITIKTIWSQHKNRHTTPETQATKQKINKCNYMKLKASAQQRKSSTKWKSDPQNEKVIYLLY